ncbi:hypothetical protein ACVFYP_15685 [Roseomonas sp. F4]
MTGRPPFAPTDEQRRLVRAMAGYGVPHEDIARVVRCSAPTLRRYFRDDLDVAVIEANARVAQTLFQQASTPGNIAATIFWLKARAGWREKRPDEAAPPPAATAPPEPLVILRRIVDAQHRDDHAPPMVLPRLRPQKVECSE